MKKKAGGGHVSTARIKEDFSWEETAHAEVGKAS